MTFYTIGLYGLNENEFFKKISDNDIDTFCDIRRRRGVRGKHYSFVNANYLQQKLKSLNITYLHVLKLAPTNEIRKLQTKYDEKNKILKRDRKELSEAFKTSYRNNILNNFDFENFIEELKKISAKKIVLFCVERHPLACHRSLVTEKLHELNYPIKHL